jgi:hypothetical protein
MAALVFCFLNKLRLNWFELYQNKPLKDAQNWGIYADIDGGSDGAG